MRHLIGFGLALVLAAAVFFGGSWGYLRLLRIPVVNGAAATLPAGGGSLLHDKNVLLAFAAVAGTALLAGLFVAVPRISPLAAGLPGLALIAWTVLYGVSVQRAVRYIPLKNDTFGDGFEAMLFNGILAAAGLAMIVPLFIPSRWRRQARPQGTEPDAAQAKPSTGLLSSDPNTGLLSSDWAETVPLPQQPGDPPRQ
jgi:hypothetical protein